MGYEWFFRCSLIQAKTLFWLACCSLLAFQPSIAIGQAIVHESRTLAIPHPYAKVLGRLEGKEAASEMFASQKVTLMEYKPRKADSSSNDKQEEGVTRASIDIVGYSHEFGKMHYLMTIAATEKQTTIQVELVKPVGMLRYQQYLYQVVPEGESKTYITISHTLDVVLMQRRLQVVNRIISKVTYKKACEELHTLTGKMVDSVHCIVHREKRKMETTKAKPSPKDEEDLEEAVEAGPQGDSSSSERRNDEPRETNNKAENGASPTVFQDKESVMPNRNDSSANLPESNPSTSALPMANSLVQDRERNVDKETSAAAPQSEKPSSETPPAQPRSETSPRDVKEPVPSKDSVDRKPEVNESTRERMMRALHLPLAHRPQREMLIPLLKKSPSSRRRGTSESSSMASPLHRVPSALPSSPTRSSLKLLMRAKRRIARETHSRRWGCASRKVEHSPMNLRRFPMDRT